MGKLNNEVIKMLEETKVWVVSTCGEKPNAIPVAFHMVKDNDLIVLDVFMEITLDNIQNNKNIAITVFNDSTLQGYQVKGIASYSTDASLIEMGNNVTSALGLTTKGVLTIKPEEAYVLTPGPDVGKLI